MGDEGNEAQIVLADAQFGMVQLMQPTANFESIYEGEGAAQPIYLFPEGDNIDPLARDGIAGYDSDLARGLPVPFGSRVVLWLPNLAYVVDESSTLGYEWVLIWRLRNVFDFRQSRRPYHFPRDQGAIDTSGADAESRVPIPAAYNTITYIQTEPSTQPGRAVNNIHAEDLEASADKLAGPLLPGGGVQPVQQGIFDPTSIADAERPSFLTHDAQAIGDELLIALRRSDVSIANWAFGTVDKPVADFFTGGTNAAVYVMVGAAP
jgi:hypothetical protein